MKKLFLSAVFIAAALTASLCGCRRGGPDEAAPRNSASPAASQFASPAASQFASPAASPSAVASASPSASPNVSPDASPTAGTTGSVTGSIEGFMEGGIVNPEDVPDITAMFSNGEEYAGMAIQSITYKLREGRQAYYVILQGVGIEDRAYYVFADGSVESADTIPGD